MIDIETLEKFMCTELAVDKKNIGHDEDLLSQGIIDSLGIIKLVTFLEDIGIKIQDNDIVPENFQTLNALYKLLERSDKNN